MPEETPGTPPWDPVRILGSSRALAALRGLGTRLRSAGYVNRLGVLQIDDPSNASLAELALGRTLEVTTASSLLSGDHAVHALVESGGGVLSASGGFSLTFEVISDGRAMAILPFLPTDGTVHPDVVYAGSDTWLLRDRAWQFALHGERAVDLGTGTGLVAAFLSGRFTDVLATDITDNALDTARLSFELLDDTSRDRIRLLRTDVAAGLEPGSFDFVCANAPWVPTTAARGRIYAEGGSTGFELPRRFIAEGAELLAKGGVMVVLCADLEFTDGSRPLADVLSNLSDRGFSARIEVTRTLADGARGGQESRGDGAGGGDVGILHGHEG